MNTFIHKYTYRFSNFSSELLAENELNLLVLTQLQQKRIKKNNIEEFDYYYVTMIIYIFIITSILNNMTYINSKESGIINSPSKSLVFISLIINTISNI